MERLEMGRGLRVWSRIARLLVVCSFGCTANGGDWEAQHERAPDDRYPQAGGHDDAAVAIGAEPPPTTADGGRPTLCARPRQDAVRDVFCGEVPPILTSLRDLQEALGLLVDPSGRLIDPGVSVAALGHSTALSGHRVSPINPRLIMSAPPLFLAYQRGVQKVEMIASTGAGGLNFYLLRFEQTCNQRPEGCLPGDLYTARVERQWLSWSLEDDEDLKNTAEDCRQCHQRARALPALLMRELNNPWTHFFLPIISETPSGPGVRGEDLLRDYVAAKGDEPYGGFLLSTLSPIAPFVLESLVGIEQPLLFDAPTIENERWPLDPESGYPSDPQPSPSWEAGYDAFKRGEQLPLPFLEARAVDVDKQTALSGAYALHRSGEARPEELPDLSDIFPDDPLVRARIGLQTEPGADAVDVMIQACGPCHNDVLDQAVSRARFNINLWALEPDAVKTAIERIERAPGEQGAMPPPEARKLDADGRERLLDYLRRNPLATSPDMRLVRAAELGMAGGANTATSAFMSMRAQASD
ncbi:MAG: hypothetical protein OXR73_20035 [Myxococcales bacterium]|nr:hypothetical protein [Myxococcales bacterium]